MDAIPDGVALVDPAGVTIEANRRLEELTGFSREELVGTRTLAAALRAIGVGGEPVEQEVELRRRDGGLLAATVTVAPVLDEGGRPAARMVTVRDASGARRLEADQHLARRELVELAQEQAALRRVATAVAEGVDPDAALALASAEAARLLGLDAGVVARFEGDRAIVAGASDRMHLPVGTWVPLDSEGAIARVWRTGAAARVDDYPGIVARDPSQSSVLPSRAQAGVAAPVRVGERIWGALVVLTMRTDAIPAEAEGRLQHFADLVAIAIANAEAQARLAALASTDSLTGLANHRVFHERLRQEVDRAERHGRPLSVAVLDLDHFKEINDTHGHHVGDRVLAEVGRLLGGMARSGELLARTGGEEFGWILPEADSLAAYAAAERARQAVAAVPIAGVGPVTLSAGVADLENGRTPGGLVQLADGALYWAKAQSRNATYRYSPDVVAELSAGERAVRLERARALRALRALARAVDSRNVVTQGHSARVASLAALLAQRLGWPAARADELREAALLHDVGLIGVPVDLPLPPAELSPAERARLQEHPVLGATMVGQVLSPEQAAWVRGHHERWDGGGYPDGLAEEGIPEGARLLALADVWDALRGGDPARVALSPDEALGECRLRAGGELDPDAVDALAALLASGRLGTAERRARISG
jgi:diguanylate cyclase (GGDEF)-like protein/PAS domain S-box-containing protein